MNLRKILLILAWVTFAVSLVLPSIKSEGFFGFLQGFYWGFMCVAGSFLGIVGLLVNIVDLLFGKHFNADFAYLALFGLCNLLMLLSPAIIFLVGERVLFQKLEGKTVLFQKLEAKMVLFQKAAFKAAFKAACVVAALIVCLPWFLSPDFRADLLAGYYVWCLSYILLAVAVNLRVIRQP